MGVLIVKELKEAVKVRKPTVVRDGDTVEECFIYQGMEKCFDNRCFWKKNGECPIADSLEGEPENCEEGEAW